MNEYNIENFPGALEDNREPELKAQDWHKDLAMSAPVNWLPKNFRDVKIFPVRNQDGSSSCVANTLALVMGIENFLEEGRFVELSARDIYTRRINQGGGMIGVDALNIAKNYGATLEVLIPSHNLNETEINKISRKISDEEIAKIFKIKDYYQLPFNVEQIATIMENGRKNGVAKPLMVWFQFPRIEWDAKPQLSPVTADLVRHSVTAVEYGLVDGKKGIFIQDSWGLHSSTEGGLRFISDEYLKKRMIFCAYVNDLENNWQTKPAFKITQTLKLGMKGEQVKELQRILGISQDGIFGKNTLSAVIAFQKKNGLTPDGIVGKNTINKLYGASAEPEYEDKVLTVEEYLDNMESEDKKSLVKKVIDML
jgi:hypothetical protein